MIINCILAKRIITHTHTHKHTTYMGTHTFANMGKPIINTTSGKHKAQFLIWRAIQGLVALEMQRAIVCVCVSESMHVCVCVPLCVCICVWSVFQCSSNSKACPIIHIHVCVPIHMYCVCVCIHAFINLSISLCLAAASATEITFSISFDNYTPVKCTRNFCLFISFTSPLSLSLFSSSPSACRSSSRGNFIHCLWHAIKFI